MSLFEIKSTQVALLFTDKQISVRRQKVLPSWHCTEAALFYATTILLSRADGHLEF